MNEGMKASFLRDLGAAMRTAITGYTGAPADGYFATVKDDIEVTVSPSQRYTNAVNVRINIPARENHLATDLSNLETNLEGNVRAKILEEVKKIDGLKYVSTWTQGAISVSIPSQVTTTPAPSR